MLACHVITAFRDKAVTDWTAKRSETWRWLSEDANCKWNDFSSTHSKVVLPFSASIAAIYVCVWVCALTWRRSSWWLYGLYTQICKHEGLGSKPITWWTKRMTNTSQKYSQRICDLTLLNHLHVNAEWSKYELDGIAEEIIVMYRTITNLMWLPI